MSRVNHFYEQVRYYTQAVREYNPFHAMLGDHTLHERQLMSIGHWLQQAKKDIAVLRGEQPLPLVPNGMLDSFLRQLSSRSSSAEDAHMLSDICRHYVSFCEVLFHEALQTLDMINEHYDYWKGVENMNKWNQAYVIFMNSGVKGFVESSRGLIQDIRNRREIGAGLQNITVHMTELSDLRREVARSIGQIHDAVYSLLKCSLHSEVHAVVAKGIVLLRQTLDSLGQSQDPREETADLLSYDSHTVISVLNACLEVYKDRVASIKKRVLCHRRPTHIEEHWVRYCVFGFGALVGARYLYNHSSYNGSQDLQKWTAQAKDAAHRFYFEHVQEPIANISQFLFNTYRNRPSIVTADEFQESRDSLTRMIRDFLKTVPQESPLNPQQIESIALSGNMDLVMRKYESELQNPLKSALSGELVRAFLIQVQKLKIDTQSAMLSMDQVLKSNELNIEMLATIPAIIVFVASIYGMKSIVLSDRIQAKRLKKMRLRLALAEIDRILQYRMNQRHKELHLLQTLVDQTRTFDGASASAEQESGEMDVGLLLHYLDQVFTHGYAQVSEIERLSFYKDVTSMLIFVDNPAEQLNVLRRMYVTYACLSINSAS